MKITRKELRKIIQEATREFKIKTVPDDQYKANVASLPDPMQQLATGQREFEAPNTRHVVGNFFMKKGVPYKAPKGYGRLKKIFNFYMTLPDGESILVNPSNFIIEKTPEAMRFLEVLNSHVTVLPFDSLENAAAMRAQVLQAVQSFNQERM
mgnify:CR=1 FL=1